jgi:DNA-binding PadR family transcriptional regulator
MTNSNVLWEDVLDALMLEEPKPSYEALVRWTERYPQYREALTEFFATWSMQAVWADLPEQVEIDEDAIVEKGVSHALEIARRQGKVVSRDKLESLSPFELLVLTAVFLLRGEGYAVTITEKLNEMSETRVTFGSAYLSLDQLESRGLLSSRYVEVDGKSRRYFVVTVTGERALTHAKETSKRLSDLLGDFA